MELEGKCREDFEKWLICYDKGKSIDKYYFDKYGDDNPYLWFIEHSLSMQYGVYVDFFDGVGLEIEINQSERFEGVWCYYFEYNSKDYQGSEYTRQEARTQAIKKANEIYNETK